MRTVYTLDNQEDEQMIIGMHARDDGMIDILITQKNHMDGSQSVIYQGKFTTREATKGEKQKGEDSCTVCHERSIAFDGKLGKMCQRCIEQ